MRPALCMLSAIFLLPGIAGGAPKPHVVSFGKWTTVKWFVGPGQDKPLDLRIRALYVDRRLKEFTLGTPHDVTDRLIVVLESCLVSRLHCLLRGLGRWQESLCDGGTTRTSQTNPKKRLWETRPLMTCRIRLVPRPVGNASRCASPSLHHWIRN